MALHLYYLRNVESIDVVPSIAYIIGTNVPWKVDGESVFSDLSGRSTKRAVVDQGKRVIELSPDLQVENVSLERKLGLFEPGHGLFEIGPGKALIGQSVSELTLNPDQESKFLIQSVQFSKARVSSWVQPYVEGVLHSRDKISEPVALLFSMNGVVQASTYSFDARDNSAKFTVLLPEAIKETDEIQVFSLGNGNEGYFIRPLKIVETIPGW